MGEIKDGTLKPELVQHYGRILCNKVTIAIQAFPLTSKEASDILYETFLQTLDRYFFFYLNVVLIEKPEQYLTKNPLESHT